MRKMPQTRRIAAQTVCHFSHNADFCQLRISKYPANAHKTNYFSALVIGCFWCVIAILKHSESADLLRKLLLPYVWAGSKFKSFIVQA